MLFWKKGVGKESKGKNESDGSQDVSQCVGLTFSLTLEAVVFFHVSRFS